MHKFAYFFQLSLFFIIFAGHVSFSDANTDAEKSQETVVNAYISAFSQLDIEAISELFDNEQFANNIIRGGNFSRGFSAQYQNLFRDKQQRIQFYTNMFIGQDSSTIDDFKFLRNVEFQGLDKVPVARLMYKDLNMEYLLFDISENNRISDIFYVSRGKWLSESIGEMTALITGQSSGLFDKFAGQMADAESAMSQYAPVVEAYTKGDMATAYKHISALPDEFQQSRALQQMRVQIGSQLNDQAYLQALDALYKANPDDPSLAFMFLDLHAMNNNPKKVIKGIDLTMQVVGHDGRLMEMKGDYATQVEDWALAEKSYTQGMIAEPDYINNYWGMVFVHNRNKDFDNVSDMFIRITDKFEWTITREDLEQHGNYVDYLQSSAAQRFFNR